MNKVDLIRVIDLDCNLDGFLLGKEVDLDEIKSFVYLEIGRIFVTHGFASLHYEVNLS